MLQQASQRLQILAQLEWARLDRLAGDLVAARQALHEAKVLVPADFEQVEIAEVRYLGHAADHASGECRFVDAAARIPAHRDGRFDIGV